jgi:hypothetical protein
LIEIKTFPFADAVRRQDPDLNVTLSILQNDRVAMKALSLSPC